MTPKEYKMISKVFLILWINLSSLFLLIPECHASGQITIRFQTYENSGGQGSNGHCCDGRWAICGSACDHQFSICVDQRYGSQNMNSCPLGARESGEIIDQDSITFGSNIGGIKNPLVFKVDSVPSWILVKVDVWDVDDNSHDHVDFLTKMVRLYPLKPDDTERVVMSGHTTLVTAILSKCDPHFYGPTCEVYCKPGPSQHFNCDPVTGQKGCHVGWTSANCSVSENDCKHHNCMNFATCVDKHRKYVCVCLPGYTGRFCERDVKECLSDPCVNNGTCIDEVGAFHCNCMEGWTGGSCETSVDDCQSEPCRNNATCTDQHNSYQCECLDGWTGDNCQTNIDDCALVPCEEGATCVDEVAGFRCICATGYTGELCQVQINECLEGVVEGANNPCQHNSTCRDTDGGYLCECTAGYEGPDCAADTDDCAAPHACRNGAICLDFVADFKCVCFGGWTGPTCAERDLCLDNDCGANATCVGRPLQGSYECACSLGWGGPQCDVPMEPCVVNACSNNGSCYQEKDPEVNSQGRFTCTCTDEWTGPTCEVPMSLYMQTTPQPPDSNSAEIFLIGEVDSIDFNIIKEELRYLLSYQAEVDMSHVELQLEISKASMDDEVNVVRVVATATSDIPEEQARLENLQQAWEEIPRVSLQYDLSYPVYYGHIKDENPESAPTENWAKSNWYIILLVIIVSLVVAFFVLVAILILRRMKKGRLFDTQP